LREDFAAWPGAASDVGFTHERRGNAATTQKTAQKKWPLRRAAKFREETPRKGGGFAIEDRNTALQQYAEVRRGAQAGKSQKR